MRLVFYLTELQLFTNLAVYVLLCFINHLSLTSVHLYMHFQQAIESGLPDKDVKTMCMKYADLEKSLGEIDRARAIYIFSSQFADPHLDNDFWNIWHEFEVQHRNEDTFREMLRIKRSVSASYSQVSYLSFLSFFLSFFSFFLPSSFLPFFLTITSSTCRLISSSQSI